MSFCTAFETLDDREISECECYKARDILANFRLAKVIESVGNMLAISAQVSLVFMLGILAFFFTQANGLPEHEENSKDAMLGSFCDDLRGKTLIEGAGHWNQQEAPEETNAALIEFLEGL